MPDLKTRVNAAKQKLQDLQQAQETEKQEAKQERIDMIHDDLKGAIDKIIPLDLQTELGIERKVVNVGQESNPIYQGRATFPLVDYKGGTWHGFLSLDRSAFKLCLPNPANLHKDLHYWKTLHLPDGLGWDDYLLIAIDAWNQDSAEMKVKKEQERMDKEQRDAEIQAKQVARKQELEVKDRRDALEVAIHNRILEEARHQVTALAQWKVESVTLYRWEWCIGACMGEEVYCEYATHYSLSDKIDPDGWLQLLDHEPIKLIADVHKPTVSRVVWTQPSEIPRQLENYTKSLLVEGAHQPSYRWAYGGAGEIPSSYWDKGQVFYQDWVEALLGRTNQVITIAQPTDEEMAQIIFEVGKSFTATDEDSF